MAMDEAVFATLLFDDYLPKLNIAGPGAAAATQQVLDLCESVAKVITYIQNNAEVLTDVTTAVATGIPVQVVPVSGTGATTAPGAGTGAGTGAAGTAVF